VKTVSTVKKPFGKANYSPVKHARYLDWEDAFDVEFDDSLSFLEPDNANKISPGAVPVRVSDPKSSARTSKSSTTPAKLPKSLGHSFASYHLSLRKNK
jgi:hypothetical protein